MLQQSARYRATVREKKGIIPMPIFGVLLLKFLTSLLPEFTNDETFSFLLKTRIAELF